MSKIQLESNSQPDSHRLPVTICCDRYVKDTIREQFTTHVELVGIYGSCDRYVKDTIREQFTTDPVKGIIE